MQIPLGFEMMIKSVIKMMGLDPVKVMNSIDGIHNALQSSATDLRCIRENQKILMEHFGLEEWKDEHERRRNESDGRAEAGSRKIAIAHTGSGT